jgi:predicted Zn-dependent peptidase
MTFKKTVLSNGLRIVTAPIKDNPSVTILVMVSAGSKYESKETNGLSHFLEHMVFKGTPKRPKAIDISRELDGIGAHYNAFTSQEFTGYYAKADVRHFDTILDVVSDMYLHPLFDESEIYKEKGVIVEEIRMYKDLPQQHVHDVFMALLYGDQPAGWNVAGTEANVNSFRKKDFLEYRKEHYVAESTTVIVAGNIDEAKAVKAVEKAFAGIPRAKKKDKDGVKESQSMPQVKTEFKETDQTHIVIGFRAFPILDRRIPAIQVLTTVLGRGMSSRLFSKMRDELGICYYIRAEHTPFTDHGMMTISAGVDNSRVEEAVKVILSECDRLRQEAVSAPELKKAKDYISGTTMLELETSDARAEFCGYQEILKNAIESPDELIKKIQKVSAAEIMADAKEIFRDMSLNLAVVGRFKDGKSFEPYFKFG